MHNCFYNFQISASGPSRLVPACPPLPTSGMTFIRLHLPVPEVVNCIQLRLYKPKDANNIGLSQIRLLGTSAFGGTLKQPFDLSEDEYHCKYSLGWLRLLHHCFSLGNDTDLAKEVVARAAQVPDILNSCCGLLLIPSHIPTLYLPNLSKVLCDLSLFDRESSVKIIKMLLSSRANLSESLNVMNLGGGKLLMNSPGAHAACELLYQVCGHQVNILIIKIINVYVAIFYYKSVSSIFFTGRRHSISIDCCIRMASNNGKSRCVKWKY